jgi:hypothetical protein
MKMEQSVQERIRERAYQLWDAGGRVEGQADQHWLCAEREILSLPTTSAASPIPGVADAPRRHSRKASKNSRSG